MRRAYVLATELVTPLLPLWLMWRGWRGKEDSARRRERFGYPAFARPKGTLFWLHAASVGEAASVLPLIAQLRARYPQLFILLTTGTKTSAELMQVRLPKGVIHQYVPIDTPDATWRFMRHWRPEFAFFVESELWPNLIHAAHSWQCFMGMINARMSEKSFAFWKKYPAFIGDMLGCFNIVFAQSDGDKERLMQLGARQVHTPGNIKYDGEPLPCDEEKLATLHRQIGTRPVWLAASTHPGEEPLIAEAHKALAARYPDVLTLIVPRHPARGVHIAAELQKTFRLALRARGDAITEQTQIYLADTLGELGLFYRVSPVVLMGGSLVAHGGQNPLEPARLACALLAGPHTHNFSDIYAHLDKAHACVRVKNASDLAAQLAILLAGGERVERMQDTAKILAESQRGATARLLAELEPVLAL